MVTSQPQFYMPSQQVSTENGSGVQMIDVGPGRVWTKRIGLPDNKINVLFLHGGPGCNHQHFECFESFLLPNHVTIYYYDQLDSLFSDKPNDKKNWTVEQYVEHVETVRKALKLGPGGNEQGKTWYLHGLSWGGMLAQEYAIRYSNNVTGVIVSNMNADFPTMQNHIDNVQRPRMPGDVNERMKKFEQAGDTSNPEYEKLYEDEFDTRFCCRVRPLPEPEQRMRRGFSMDIYHYMQGPNEMMVIGAMKDWTCWDRLKNISVRTLFIGAKNDTMDPDGILRASKLVPNGLGECWISETGAHECMWDDQQNYMKRVLQFIFGTQSFYMPNQSDGIQTGGVQMIDVGPGRVWTKKLGVPEYKINLLLLHGGPGCNHQYFECFQDYMFSNHINVYYYDQLDSNYSDKPNDKKNWSVDQYVEHVEIVRKALGLGPGGNEQGKTWYLLGHSWGGMLAQEYAVKYSANVTGVIVSNMNADFPTMQNHIDNVQRPKLPGDINERMKKFEQAGDTSNPEYEKLYEDEFVSRYICRAKPLPEPILRMRRTFSKGIYNYMQGPNETMVIGAMKDWTVWDRLKNITVKTLFIGAVNDTMDPEKTLEASKLVPNGLGECWISETGSHECMWDDQQNYMKRVLQFILQ